jgi:hypothetical protein
LREVWGTILASQIEDIDVERIFYTKRIPGTNH